MADKKLHVLVIPFPVQSHINQMLEFSKSIATSANDLKVTFILTSNISKFAPNTPLQSSFTFETIPDGSEHVQERETSSGMFKRFETVFSENLIKFVDNQKGSLFPAKVVVYDSVFPWILDIVREHGLIGTSFFTQSCAASAIYYHVRRGTLKFPYEDLTVSLPSMPALGMNDLPSFSEVKGPDQSVLNLLEDQFSNLENVDWVLFNTFHGLEHEFLRWLLTTNHTIATDGFTMAPSTIGSTTLVINWMASRWPIKTVGPTNLLSQKHNKGSNENNYAINMFEPNYEACREWLDSKETGSVTYVSLGSLIRLNEQQMEELAQGLIMSNCYFLWVVRGEERHKLPPSFTSLICDKGLVVNWCSQTHVLNHRAISCFLTHGGWNSTMEALSLGVPLIAMPHWVDQTLNSKFIEDVWKVGVRIKVGENGIVWREEIANCLNEVVEGEKWKKLKRNSDEWKTLAEEAIGDGGSTANNVEDFVSALRFSYMNL